MIIMQTPQVPTPDERRAEWAYAYNLAGYYREPPENISQSEPDEENDP